MVTQTITNDLVSELKLANCLKWGDFTLKNGDKSDYYIDLREATYSPVLFKKLVATLISKIRILLGAQSVDELVVVGVPYGVVPIAGAVAHELGCRYAPLRKEVKSYGRANDLSPLKGLRFIVIEDVMSSGASIKEALEKLDGHNVTDVLVIANREADGEENIRMDYPRVKVHSILRVSDMVKSKQ